MSTNMKLVWGPGSMGNLIGYAYDPVSAHQLNDNDRRVAAVGVCIPKDGTITDVGFLITAKAGTPPAYNFGLVTVDSSGAPTTTAYGGSAVTAYAPTATGWLWVTLSTSATAAAGDLVAIYVYPGATAPDGSNNITVAAGSVGQGLGHARYKQYGYWYENTSGPAMAIRYSDGTVHGYALTSDSPFYDVRENTTPDEVGCKFTLPLEMSVTGVKFLTRSVRFGASAAFDVVIYDGSNNVVKSLSVSDKDYLSGVDDVDLYFDAVTLSANTTYRVVIKPTVATNGDVYVTTYFLESAAARNAFPCGADWQLTTRTDAGAWTDTATAIVPIALHVAAITVPTSGASSFEYAYIG